MARAAPGVWSLVLEAGDGAARAAAGDAGRPFHTGIDWVTAEDLKVGGWIAESGLKLLSIVEKAWIAGPIKVHNLEVAGAETYFVGAVEAWAHNANRRIRSKNWRASRADDESVRNGCECVARDIQRLIGGDVFTLFPKGGAPMLGGMKAGGVTGGWAYHVVVVRDGRVYDALTGCAGKSISEYKSDWKYADEINWPF